MSAIYKDFYTPEHPGYEEYMKLVKKGCPKCGERLYNSSTWPTGLVYCSDVHVCAMEFQYDGHGGWILDANGKPGKLNERFRFSNETEEYVQKAAEYRRKLIEKSKPVYA